MTSPARVWQAAPGGPLDLGVVVAALSAHFEVATGAKEVVRRTRLDTFDRRLLAAGLTLEHRKAAAGSRLVLSRPDGTQTVAAPDPEPTWPAPAGVLPPGPVRDAVAPAASIRALLVVSDEKRRVRRLELHNRDGKTVARLELDEPVSATSTKPAEITVLALRGYDDQARRALRLLAGSGLRPVDGAAASRPPDAPEPTGADRATASTELLAGVLGGFLEAMRVNLPGLLEDVDTEFLHDFRVAVRRTRSTLKLGRPALPEVMAVRWEPAFKWLGDLTTPVRDLDVYELALPTMASWLVSADAADLEPFGAFLRRRRKAQRGALVRGLKSARFARLVTDWELELARLADAPPKRPTAGELADRNITRAFRRVARGGAAIGADSPATDLHTLRKRCKELRYALEVFAPVLDRVPRKRAVGDLKVLQDVLGRFQDSEVQRHALREFAQQMVAGGASARVVLAMGELVGHLDAEQGRARAAFEGAFAGFVRPASLQRMKQLGGGR